MLRVPGVELLVFWGSAGPSFLIHERSICLGNSKDERTTSRSEQ